LSSQFVPAQCMSQSLVCTAEESFRIEIPRTGMVLTVQTVRVCAAQRSACVRERMQRSASTRGRWRSSAGLLAVMLQ
jgi:hypothetical protein